MPSRFLILSLLVASAGFGRALASAEKTPVAAILVKREVVECVLSTRKIPQAGAWVWLFSNGLDTGSRESMGGLSGVDYKLEGGRFYRFVREDPKSWREICAVVPRVIGEWQIFALPRQAFLFSDRKITWRLALFPHNRTEPLFLPESAPGATVAGKFLDLSPLRPGLPSLECFYRDGLSAGRSLDWWSELMPVGLSGAPPPPVEPVYPAHCLRTGWNEPIHRTFFWPVLRGKGEDAIFLEGKAAEQVPAEAKAIVFAPAPVDCGLDVPALAFARASACRLTGRLALFLAESAEDLPANADGALLRWPQKVEPAAVLLQELAGKLPRGRVWIVMDRAFFALPSAQRDLSLAAFAHFGVRLMLTPELIVEELGHAETTALLWYALQLSKAPPSKGGEVAEPALPLPPGLKEPRWLSLRHHAYDLYLRQLFDEVDRLASAGAPLPGEGK